MQEKVYKTRMTDFSSTA